ncbi:hypothetical protein JCGZ_02181 [Jatropha curcas]|uniref:Glycosyltransferase N-terminal domain-containing protein n=1 Tax=Jatropha curcas TaxID=180498 RepID=A0A067KZ01_JATCU|nr:UDP-glycosyltransferase 89B2 [Jatropha curcas]KDP40183.1 hypothetical protein JCGZ_02181 [Jatropha curcas]
MTILDSCMGTHVLVFPYPAQGHLIPTLDLTHQLATSGLTITILVTPKNLPLLNPILSKHPSIQTLILPFPSHNLIPPGAENAKDLPPNYTPIIAQALCQLYEPLLDWFKSHPSPPRIIISDILLGWTQTLACQLNIRNIVFSPSGAMALSVIYTLWTNLPKKDINDQVLLSSIPNCPTIRWENISSMYRNYIKKDDSLSKVWMDLFLGDMASWGLIFNSFSEMERVYLDHLKRQLGHDRVWAVGPLLPCNDKDTGACRPAERGGASSVSVEGVTTWLDKCKDHSVVYICFGSQAVLRNSQIAEIASGLEKSGVHFIWCVKEPTAAQGSGGSYGRIPSGFENRVAGRGLVIRGWVPQVVTLGHRAIGAFLTHCGWNSVLEGVVAGVPMLAWPMTADQFSDAFLLVNVLNVGITVCEGADTVPNSAELAKVFVKSVSENLVERTRAKQLSKAALDAIKDEGSSAKDFDCLVHHLVQTKLQTS